MTKTSFFKRILSRAARPLALLTNAVEHWHRFWSFVRLDASLSNVDPSIVVLGMPELHGTRKVTLGRNLYLYRDLHFETQETGDIRIGDGVVISRGVHLVAFAGIDIGAGSMIGEYASVRDANHRFGPGLVPRHSGHVARPIRIGRNVWIGRGATILPGVSIGEGAVIGANAVVTCDVLPYTVAGGIPARPLHRKGQS